MDKYALVTGSSRGIGKAIAIKLANEGYNVAIHYNQAKNKAEEVAKEIEALGQKAFIYQADVSKDSELEEMFKKYTKEVGELDLLVNNVGFDYGKLIKDYTFEEMRYVIDVVLFSKIAATKLALPLLKKSKDPVIVNIASRMGKEKTIKTIGAYGPAEAGVIKWTQACALEFEEFNIRVNCVAPGLTYTDMSKGIVPEEVFKASADANPRHRIGEPEDVANVVAFMASPGADYVNGETIGVNGGSNLG